MGLENLLQSKGHQVAFFAMQSPLNEPSNYSSYFPSELDYSKRNLKNVGKQVLRPLYSREVKRKFIDLLNYFKPDLVHVHNIHSQLSPIIVEESFKRKIPIIWSLHDYKLICPRYDCRRDDKPCELCFIDKRNVIRYRCMKNSLAASILAYAEAIRWHREKLSAYTSHFICPSEFIRRKMISGGFDENMFTTINNFINIDKFDYRQKEKENYYCYVGRLSKEKGVETLLQAARELPQFQLKIIGTGPQYDYFIKEYDYSNIEFCGFKPSPEVHKVLLGSKFSVMPSECYENNPLAVIESLCLGTPFIGAETGGVPELVVENKNGMLFESGNKKDLTDKIKLMWDMAADKFNTTDIAQMARERFSAENFYKKLLKVYQDVLDTSRY